MQFGLSTLATAFAAILSSARAVPTSASPAIEMNFYNHNTCARFSIPEPTYVSTSQNCSALPYPGLSAYYYNQRCQLTVYQGSACQKGYGWELLRDEDGHCWDLSSFGSYEAVCSNVG